jgi:diaminopimelate decarboxylase
MDVASLGEPQHTLGAGFTPAQIMATGPKSPEFLWLAARSGAAVNVDGRGELDDLAAVVRRYGLPRVRVLLRLSSFSSPGVRLLSRQSRFGTPVGELGGLLKAVERHQDAVDFTEVGYTTFTRSPVGRWSTGAGSRCRGFWRCAARKPGTAWCGWGRTPMTSAWTSAES